MVLHRYSLVLAGLLIIALVAVAPVSAADISIIPNDPVQDSIQGAIINATPGDRIILGPGIYSEHDIIIDKDITIRSGSGSATDTIIDAETLGRIFDNSAGHSLAIDNLTLQDGFEVNGGAISTNGGTVTVTNSTFSNCTSNGNGGAIYISGGTLSVDSSVFENCSAKNGGAISATGTITTTITSSRFSGCSATDPLGFGGAILSRGTLTVTSSAFENCSAGSGGGAISPEGLITITSSTFHTCSAGFSGGAIGSDSPLTILSSTFEDCSAGHYGGAIVVMRPLSVTSSTFSNCTAANGGAVFSQRDLTLTNSSFFNCRATDGGAIYNDGGTLSISGGSTFSGSSATGNGGAIWSNDGDIAIGMTTISSCTATSGGAIHITGGTLTAGGVDIINCMAADNGGAIHAALSPVTIFHSDFTNCSAVAGNGGAVWTSGDPLTMYNTNWFLNCTAGDSGGAIYYDNVAVSIHGTMIWLCSAANNGGGIAGTGPVTVIGSSFGECSSGGDGGLISGSGDLEIRDTLFFRTSASGDGGAISTGGGTLNVTTSVFEYCQAGRGGAVRSTGTGDIHYTRFYLNTATGEGPAVHASAAVNATNNWWGSNSDPAARVFGPVTTDPWLVLGITADPAAIMSTENSTISTNLTYNSAGADTSSGGSLMEYNILNWYAVTAGSGSVSPAMDTIYQRIAQTTFTPLYGETVTISGTVDEQTVYITLPVAQAAPVPTGITPSTGINTTSTAITDLSGSSFTIIGTTTVILMRAGHTNITATGVTVVDTTQITCTLPITGAGAGTWDVVVINPDGQEGLLPGGFTITAPGPAPVPTAPTAVPTYSPDQPGDDSPPAIILPMTVTVNIGGNSKAWQAIVTGTKLSELIVTGTVQSGPGSNQTAPPGIVYQYLTFVPVRYTSITKAVINFTVPQSWLDENHIAPGSIVLYRQTANGWEALPTTVLYTKDGTAFFSAVSPGFSLFAIAGTPAGATPTQVLSVPASPGSPVKEKAPVAAAVTQKPVVTGTTIPPAPAEVPAGFSSIPVLPAVVVLGAIGLIGGGIVARRWWVRRQNPALFADCD
ncbi:MAG: PGF-pre-PGF domain-containing protein [Methanoregula sp.]|nr:PGF-pre-PGF domain-containing protein [Methanoregula sp.]